MRICPTESYSIDLPSDIQTDSDNKVASYWRAPNDLLLQLSSHARFEGVQIPAGERLIQRLAKNSIDNISIEALEIERCPDCASASTVDQEGLKWFYCYAVWPELSIFITISGSPELFKQEMNSWAFQAVKTIRVEDGRAA